MITQTLPRLGIGLVAAAAFTPSIIQTAGIRGEAATRGDFRLTRPHQRVNIPLPDFNDKRRSAVANHLTPAELADERHIKRQEVIGKCVEMGVPIFRGRIDKSLFQSSLAATTPQAHPQVTRLHGT
jgi:hypothetical protein